jgi:hypothetical protein
LRQGVTMQPRVSWKCQSSYFRLLSAGIIAVHHHSQPPLPSSFTALVIWVVSKVI